MKIIDVEAAVYPKLTESQIDTARMFGRPPGTRTFDYQKLIEMIAGIALDIEILKNPPVKGEPDQVIISR